MKPSLGQSSTRSDRLAGKVALVTGAGSGIGRGCALMCARHGARVVGSDLDATAAQETVALAAKEGLTVASLHPIDLTVPDDVERMVARAVAQFRRLDILVNAGAWGAFEWIENMDYERHWRRTLAAELDSVFLVCKAAWPHLKSSGAASIINFASANAYVALQGSAALAHCAGKGGVLSMTRQLAMEGAPYRIRANTISPGLVVTAATRPVIEGNAQVREAVCSKMMIGRFGQPEDIAWTVVYLASEEASWVTGADFPIDGGATAW
jgi:NAD(P)-dependent dehydrogenase (short-subunit alcohol dehydrogenase family)